MAIHNVSAAAESVKRVERLVKIYTEKSGTTTHPDEGITRAVVQGLAQNLDKLGRPLCPCRFYPSPAEEVKHRTPSAAVNLYQVNRLRSTERQHERATCGAFVDERCRVGPRELGRGIALR